MPDEVNCGVGILGAIGAYFVRKSFAPGAGVGIADLVGKNTAIPVRPRESHDLQGIAIALSDGAHAGVAGRGAAIVAKSAIRGFSPCRTRTGVAHQRR